ncbi:MAG: winged helix-turn-helix domain-containing protein [Alistipes sp.]|nr:winged helix-turn-helix domain-containing protein [Alistipes sp.]
MIQGLLNEQPLNVFISRLRHHLGEDSSIEIANVRGVGYKLRVKS